MLGQTSWRGTSSTAWSTAGNWTAGVPTASVDAIIGDANFTGAFQPTLTAAAVCKSLTIGTGATGSTLTLGAQALTVSGGITIGATGTINRASAAITQLTGDFNNSGTYNDTAGTIIFAGSSQALTLSGTTTFLHVTINAGTAVTQTTGTCTIKDFTITAGGTMLQQGGTILMTHDWKNSGVFNSTGGTVQFTASGGAGPTFAATNQFYHLVVNSGVSPGFDNAAGSSIQVAGNYTNNNASLIVGVSATFSFNGSGSQTIYSAAGANTFGHFVLNKSSGTLTLASDIGAAGNWTNLGGTLNGASYTVTLQAVSGSINGPATTTFPNLTIDSGANYTLNTNATCSALTFLASATASSLTHTGTVSLTVNGNVTVNQPTASFTTAWNINAGSATVTGNVSMGGVNTTTARVAKIAVTSGSLKVGGTLSYATNTASVTEIVTVSTGTITLTNALSLGSGQLNVTGAGTLIFNSNFTHGAGILGTVSGSLVRIGGNYTNNSAVVTWTAGALTEFSSNSVIAPVAAITFADVRIASGASVWLAGNISVKGDWTHHGSSFNAATFTVTFNDVSAQLIGGTAESTFNGLTLNNASGVSLNTNITVTGALTLTAGKITTGANRVRLASGGSIASFSATKYIVGNFEKFIAAGTNAATFEVGGASSYTPITLALSGVTTGGYLLAGTITGDHPNIGSSDLSASISVNRYWKLVNSGTVLSSYSATFNYVAGDLDAGVNTSFVETRRYSAGVWSTPTQGTRTSTNAQATGLTGFGDFQLGDYRPVPTLNSISPANGIPGQTINVTFTGSNFASGASSVSVGAGMTVNLVTVNSSTQLVANITISAGAALGTYNFFVINASPGGGTSSAQTFTVDTVTRWKGTVSTDWSNTGNWTAGVPTASLDALIGDASFTGANQPALTVASVCKSLTLGTGTKVSTLTVGFALTVSGNVSIGANGTITHSGSTVISLSGNWSNSGSYVGSGKNSMVTFSGAAQSIGGTTAFKSLTVNVGSIVTLNGAISATKTLSVSGTFNPNESPTYAISGAAALTVAAGGKILVKGSLFTDNYALSGAITLNAASTVEYAAATASQTINNALTYGTLAISGTGTRTLAGNLPALNSTLATAGNINVVSGTLDLSSFTAARGVTVAGGTFTVANGATLRIGGTNTFPASYSTHALGLSSTVEYSGAAQTVTAESYGHLILSSSSAATKTMPITALTVAGNLTSVTNAGGASVSFTAGAALTVNGHVSLGAATTFGGSNFSHTVGANWTNNGTFTGSASSVTLSGTAASLAGVGTNNFNNLTFSGAGITAANITDLNVAGNFTTTGAGTFTHLTNGAGKVTLSGTNKTISGTGINFNHLTVSGSISTAISFGVGGNLATSGSLSASAGTLTMSGAGSTISGAGTNALNALNVTGSISTTNNFSLASDLSVAGSLSATVGTVTFNGTSSLSGTPNLFHVTLNGTKLTLGSGSVLGVAGSFALTSGTFDVTTAVPNTVNYNAGGAQTALATTYDNLAFSGSGVKTNLAALIINRDLNISSGATFSPGPFTNSVAGNWVNNGAFTAGSSSITLIGSLDTAISGAATFNALTVNKSSSANVVTLNTNITVATLNMTQGVLDTGAKAVTLTSTRTGGGIIVGTITRTHSFTTGVAYAFEGTNHTVTFASASGVSSITMTVTPATVSDFPFGSSINRAYLATVTASGAYSATLRLHYNDAELNGNRESTMQLWRNSSSWAASGKTGNDAANNWVEQSGLTNLAARWTLSDSANVVIWNGSTSTAWETAANWTAVQGSPNLPPSTNDIVELGVAAFTFQPAITSVRAVKSLLFGSAQAITLTLGAGGALTTEGNVLGNWSGNATHTISVGNQNLNVGGNLTLSDGTNGHAINLTIGSGSVTVLGSVTESGGANITFTGAGNLSLADNFNYVSGTFTPGSGTVTYNGAGAQIVASVTYNHLSFEKTGGTATLSASTTVNGNLTLTNSGTLGVNAPLTVAGNVTIHAGTILDTAGATISVGGNWTRTGTFTPEGGSIVFNGSGAQSIGASTFNHLTVNKSSGTASLAGNLTINGDLNVSAGSLDLATFTATRSSIGGTFTLAANALLKIGNTFPVNFGVRTFAASSTVEYNGSAAQTVSAETYGRLIFSNGGGNAKTLAGATSVAGDLVINGGATFGASSFSLGVSGHWTNNGAFTPQTSAVTLSGAGKNLSGANTFNALTVSGSYTAASGITVNGAMTVSGSYAAGGTTNTFAGNFVNNGSFTSSGTVTCAGTGAQTLSLNAGFSSTGTVNFNGSVAPTFGDTTVPVLQNVSIVNTGGVTPNLGWTINGNFTVASGATFTGGSATHTMLGNFTNNGSVTSSGTLAFSPTNAVTLSLRGTAFSSSGTVTFGGMGQITLAGGTPSFTSVTIANTHTAGITPASNWTLTGNLEVSAGATFNGGSGLTHTLAGNISDNGAFNGGTSIVVLNGLTEISGIGVTTFHHLTMSGYVTNLANIAVSGNFTNNGAFDATGFPVSFTGGGASTIAGSTTPTPFDALVIAKSSATVTLAVNINSLTALTISGGTLDSSTFTISQAAGGVLTASAGGTLKIGGSNALPTFTSYSLDAASTVEFSGSSTQLIAAQNYGHLTSSSSGARILTNSGAIGVAGAFTPGANSYTITGSTVNFNGSGAQTIPAFNFHHLTNSSTGARTLAASGTVGVAGTFTPGANTFTVTGSTMNFNGAAQTMPAFTYGNLTTSGSGVKTLGGDVTVGGALILGAGSLADGGFVATVAGDINNNVTHSGTGKILLSGGTTNHVLTGTGAFENLELSDTNSAVLNATNLVINGTLTLATGTIVTGTNRVIVATAGTVSRTNGHVAGSLQKSITSTLTNRVFEIGDATIYAPVTVILTNVTVAGMLTASTTTGDHPAMTNSGLSSTRSVNRYWSLANSGITFNNASAVFQFAASDIDAGADPSTFLVAKRTSGTWTLPTVGTKTSTNIQALGLTSSFGDFQVGQSTNLPSITTQPQSQSITVGQNVTFTAAAEGAATLAYQWRFNGTNLSGATSTNLVITNVQSSHAGSYTIVVTNFNGAETSSVALLTVLRASTTNVLASSTNPALPGSNVTFTATLSVLAPGSGALNGTVQFRADGTALGSPAALVNGLASVSTTSLAHGARTITAEFAGDSNFSGSTNSLSQMINTPPVAANDTITRYPNGGVRVPLATLLTNDSDADLDTLTPTISSTSLFGGTITVSGSYAVYTPPAGFTNADSFTYSIADGFGGSAVATVAVNLVNDTAQSQNSAITFLGSGSFRLTFWGIPGRAYTVQATTNIVTPSWFALTNLTAATNGLYETIDTPPTNTPSRFYRSVYP